jgi:hypothetical protein
MPVTLTITAKSGPNLQNTAAVFVGTGLLLLPDRKICQLFTGGDTNSPPDKEFDLTGTTVLTATLAGTTGTLAVTIS